MYIHVQRVMYWIIEKGEEKRNQKDRPSSKVEGKISRVQRDHIQVAI